MKFCLVFVVLVAGAFAAEKYTSAYENIDVDSILSNKRILTNYIKCMLDEGPCTADGRELKSEFNLRHDQLLLFSEFDFGLWLIIQCPKVYL